MHIHVNGQDQKTSATTLTALLAEMKLDCARIVCEKNGEIVPRERFETTKIVDGDKLELVHFVGGG